MLRVSGPAFLRGCNLHRETAHQVLSSPYHSRTRPFLRNSLRSNSPRNGLLVILLAKNLWQMFPSTGVHPPKREAGFLNMAKHSEIL